MRLRPTSGRAAVMCNVMRRASTRTTVARAYNSSSRKLARARGRGHRRPAVVE
jgi:hypothetical protein